MFSYVRADRPIRMRPGRAPRAARGSLDRVGAAGDRTAGARRRVARVWIIHPLALIAAAVVVSVLSALAALWWGRADSSSVDAWRRRAWLFAAMSGCAGTACLILAVAGGRLVSAGVWAAVAVQLSAHAAVAGIRAHRLMSMDGEVWWGEWGELW
jgi:hypothetical protein